MVPVNYLAVLVAAIVSMVLGFLWYGPIFGKQWIYMMGWNEADCKGKQKQGMGVQTYVLMIVGSLVMAYVLAHSVIIGNTYFQATGVHGGLMAGFWNWLGFVAPVMLGRVLWEGQSWKLWVLNNGYYLLSLLLMGALLSVWM